MATEDAAADSNNRVGIQPSLVPSQVRSNGKATSRKKASKKNANISNTSKALSKKANEFIPQDIISSTDNKPNVNIRNDHSKTRRKRGKKPKAQSTNVESAGRNKDDIVSTLDSNKVGPGNKVDSLIDEANEQAPKTSRRSRNRSKKAQLPSPPTESTAETSAVAASLNQKVKKPRPKKRKPKKKFPWRAHIPEGSLDPITLDPINALSYPPFALVIEPPYIPVHSFPQPPGSEKALHLFDGRVLAYYLISQLQFIDPLNRRDLTRPELLSLDKYLQRHRLGKARVVEAYDSKGVTISAAGSEAQTARGRTRMLQEEAATILGALFEGLGSTANTTAVADTSFRNNFERQYMDHERRANNPQHSNNNNTPSTSAAGVIHEQEEDYGGGFLMIDDDENPGLRGGHYANATSDSTNNNSISNTHRQRQVENLFPSLPVVSTEPSTNGTKQDISMSNNNGTISRSLKKISKTITKTDPAQIAKQKRAREEMQRRAALSQQTFINYEAPKSIASTNNVAIIPDVPPPLHSLDAQLERNRNLAMALDVTPSTSRSVAVGISSGWARPTTNALDEFGNELNSVQYPESLVSLAKDRTKELLKLERKWKLFLLDDKTSSLSLNSMLRDMRIFVHGYSDFWKLETESYDKEPNRYIHCRKLRDTCAPYPLLSDAVRNVNYKPLKTPVVVSIGSTEAPPLAEAVLAPREFHDGENRIPLPLLPRSVNNAPPGAIFEDVPIAQVTSSDGFTSIGTRFQSLGRADRPKLNLEPRTIPRELPPFASVGSSSNTLSSANLQEKRRLEEAKKRAQRENKESILAAAFASDDDDSDWGEEEAVYCSSDDE